MVCVILFLYVCKNVLNEINIDNLLCDYIGNLLSDYVGKMGQIELKKCYVLYIQMKMLNDCTTDKNCNIGTMIFLQVKEI